MKQYTLTDTSLELRVKKSPMRGRIFFIIALFFFCLVPFCIIYFIAQSGAGLSIGIFFAFGFYGLVAFYFLRLLLWNTKGKETITFLPNHIEYVADYGYFKDGKKIIERDTLGFGYASIGYEEDQKGLLALTSDDKILQSVVKMPIEQLEQLISELDSIFK